MTVFFRTKQLKAALHTRPPGNSRMQLPGRRRLGRSRRRKPKTCRSATFDSFDQGKYVENLIFGTQYCHLGSIFVGITDNIPCSAIVSQVPDEKELRDLQQEMWKCCRKAMDPRGLNFWIFCKRIKQQANAQHQLSPEEKTVHGPELV